MPGRGKAVWLSLVFAASLPSAISAQATIPSSLQVRPCTANENAVGASPEVIRLLEDETPTFSWCEAMNVTWLPNAKILRFHTAIDVDYALVYTIVKATSESPLRLIRAAGEGLVALPSPSAANYLRAMNGLLGSVPALNDSQLESASILYLFLIHREVRQNVFSRPATKYALAEADFRMRYQKDGSSRLVWLSTQTYEWKFTFSLHKDRLHLNSVVRERGD